MEIGGLDAAADGLAAGLAAAGAEVGVGCAAGEHAASTSTAVDNMPTTICGGLFKNKRNVYLSENRTRARVNGP